MSRKLYPYTVTNFTYNGFMGTVLKGTTSYKVAFSNWTGDPGIARMICSDGKARLIPTFALRNNVISLPPDNVENRVLFGRPSRS